METRVAARWPRIIGYPTFFLVCFVFFFHLTLPYGLFQERIIDLARQNGHTVTISSLGPAMGFGVTAKRLAIVAPPATAPAGAAPAPPAPDTIIDQLTIRPTLFPLGFKVAAKAFGGEMGAQVSGWVAGTKGESGSFSKLESVSIKNLDLSKAGMKSVVGLDLDGVLSLEGEVAHMNELSKATGNLKITGRDLALLGGEVANYPLPKLVLGALDVQLKMDTGKASFDKFSIAGGDLDAAAEGDVTLNNHLAMSPTKLKLEFKPSSAWLANKNNETFKMGLSLAGHPDSKGFYAINLDGLLGSPRPSLRN